ncbi:olfactory receptor 6C2-like [Gracilinanus agilis]|uniref:olfactory receptor 6C2-like n=1 Tax=Gracilinanus agilis TaxID=191870 RepID=UPI001CFF409C|nr:olfactory receptor 6C2-like [Gracilinanus agilis]
MTNHTRITVFILQGLTDNPQLQVWLFIFLFLNYLLSLTGNLTIIILTLVDPHLKTPMYFFLRNFSFLEVSLTTSCIPRYLYSISTGDKMISRNACYTQIFFVILLGAVEFFLLATMSYDRYVAICKPLHYTAIMNRKVCNWFLLSCWIAGLMIILPPLGMGLELEFCDPIIDHFSCDTFPLLEISCTDTQLIEGVVLIDAILTLISTLLFVIWSYAAIVRTILRFPSAQQRKKAFSTCSSHMVVVSISYGSCIFMYIKPSGNEKVDMNKVVSVLMASVAPVMNPFIYTLRNKQVIQAFKNLVKKIAIFTKQ